MSAVRVWNEPAVIPTYEIGAADRNPMFLEKRVYQGSTGKIYPYPSVQEISRTKTDKIWNAVYLENEYLKVMILPELGGRIQRAYDKTNGYDFVYYNHVIKPALVGLTGPWISGGIEFNWPQHHRPTTYMPVDYEMRENTDGSKSVLLHDVDQMYGTQVITTITLYPGKAYIEIRGQLYNRTPVPQTFLWWANPAVSVNDHTQSVFPPDVHSVYDHGKRAVSRFPIATGEYYKHDYSEGVDISRYKNIPVPTSYMAEKSDYDFVGGYDYEKKAGLLHVADHHFSPGKKQWTWGCGDFGKAWDRNLTDEDGPYIELMTGVYCDNQPDFSWLKPFEEKTFAQYFMPYKSVGRVKNATIHAALNVETREDGLYICAYGTQVYEEAQVVVTCEGREIYREGMRLSPVEPFEKTLPILGRDANRVRNVSMVRDEIAARDETGVRDEIGTRDEIWMWDENEVWVAIIANGRELVAYQPQKQGIPKPAEPANAALAPQDIMTNEELFLTGQHIEQYRHATYLPDPYYLEGLKRDAGDIRINNAYGLLLFRRGLFAEAESYFRKALVRLTRLNPNPYDSESYYNLGLALFYQERFDAAYDAFYKATWTNEQQEMSFYFLAAIALRWGNFANAQELVEKGLVKNAHNVKARGLKAVILGKMGHADEALAWIRENLEVDAFDYVSRFERYFLTECKTEELDEIRSLCRNFHETFLRVARDYAEFGEYERAVAVLEAYEAQNRNHRGNRPDERAAVPETYEYLSRPLKPDEEQEISKAEKREHSSPLIYYYKAYYLGKLGKSEEAAAALAEAEACDPAYCFPNKLEDIPVLRNAIAVNPDGRMAYYYLGNLFYDKLQYDEAIRLWEASENLDDSFPTLERNLAIAYYNKKQDPERALIRMERAFALDRNDARVFLELDQLYVKMGVVPERRLAAFEENIDLIQKRDDLYTEYVTVLNLCGRNQEAYEAIREHDFRTWEGAEGKITAQFKTALLEMAKGAINENARKAESLLREALSYPENLGEGRLEGTKDNHLYFLLGNALDMQDRREEAAVCYEKATCGEAEPAGMMYYYDQPADMILYQGWAYKILGKKAEANARFYKLLDYGERHVRDEFKMDYFAVSMPDMSVFDADMTEKNRIHCCYLMGLGKLGLGRNTEAIADFEEVLRSDPNHQNAAIYRAMAEK